MFATVTPIASLGPFQLDRKNYNWGHAYRVEARGFRFEISKRKLELRIA